MSKLTCQNCGYWYKGKNDIFPCCQYDGDIYPAPCEYEDDDEEEVEEEYTLEDLGRNWW